MALMIGVPLLLFGIAMVLDRYLSWLGWTGLVIGGITMLAAVGLFLIPSLFPGFLLYGVLGSVIAQLWLVATGIVMLRRARVAPGTAKTAKGASTTVDDVEASSTAASRNPSRTGSRSRSDSMRRP